MKTRSWNQLRSDFNHGWLRNRLLIALCKAQNVLDGKVVDRTIWAQLEQLLTEWQEWRIVVRDLISGFRVSGSPARAVISPAFSTLDANVRDWLGSVADQRWEAAEQPATRMERAFEALNDFEREAATVQGLLARLLKEDSQPKAANARLGSFLNSARALAGAISSLDPSRI